MSHTTAVLPICKIIKYDKLFVAQYIKYLIIIR